MSMNVARDYTIVMTGMDAHILGMALWFRMEADKKKIRALEAEIALGVDDEHEVQMMTTALRVRKRDVEALETVYEQVKGSRNPYLND